jgi:uncharacterized membrane protein
MHASYTGLLAGMLLALAIVMGATAVLLVILLGALGFVVGALLSGEHRAFRRYARRRR